MSKGKRRILSLFIISALLFSALCFGALAEEELSYEIVEDTEGRVIQSGGNNPGEPLFLPGVSLMDTTYEQLDNLLYQGWKNQDDEIDIASLGVSKNEIGELYHQIINAHPDMFYVSSGCKYWINSQNIVTIINPDYILDLNDPNKIEAFDQATNYILSSAIEPGMSDEEKVLAIHDALVLHCDYDLSLFQGNMPDSSYTAYGALVEQTAVCQGYALAFQWLLSKVGISSVYVPSDSMNHGWNAVSLNENWYHVDTTWDDPTFNVDGNRITLPGYVGHTYFLLSDDGFPKDREDHSRLDHYGWTEWVPDCSSNKYEDSKYNTLHNSTLGYFYHNGGFVTVGSEGIIRTTMDGSATEVLNPEIFFASRMICYDDVLYFLGLQGLQSYDINSGVDMILNLNLDGVNGLSLKKAGSELQSEILQGDSKIQKSTVYITEYLAPLTVGMPICYDAEELLADPSITNLSESILVITNNNDNAMNGQLCIAAYDAQNKMVDITIQDISIQGQKTAHVAIEEQISMQGIDKIKLLFISKDGKITPLTNQAVVIGI